MIQTMHAYPFTWQTFSPSILFLHNFENNQVGNYADEWTEDWHAPKWNNGIDEGRVSVEMDTDANRGKVLVVRYPAGVYGSKASGAQWRLMLDGSYKELYLAYKVKFGAGFDFVRGGKLPGLVGGSANTGGNIPDGTDGWSARMMWRANGKLVYYVYHPDQPGKFGQDLLWQQNGEPLFVKSGIWYHIQHRVVMNMPGKQDGILQGWLDGEEVFLKSNLRFRDVDALAIDALYFSTFFGGGNQSFAPAEEQVIYFDDFVVATEPIPNSLGISKP